MDLQTVAADVMKHGPSRVVIDREGTGVSSRRAREDHGINPDVVFIRDDGWTLGAPAHLEYVAERMWSASWVGVLRRGSDIAEPYGRRG